MPLARDQDVIQALAPQCPDTSRTPIVPNNGGANENLNGLVREYCPKGKSLAHVNQLRASLIAMDLNRRPRKRLDFHTPARIFAMLSKIPESRVLYRMR